MSFTTLPGRWELSYGGNFGYDFRFYRNYKSLVILNLRNEALIFKGVYTLEGAENSIRINIFEMKSEGRLRGSRQGFVKAKSSYFVFKAGILKSGGEPTLVLRPATIMIDNNNSEGYFEPVLKLRKRG